MRGELDGHRHLHRWSKGRGRVVVVCFLRCALYFFLSFFALLCSACVFVVPSSDQFFGMLYFMGSWGNKARQLRSVTHLFLSRHCIMILRHIATHRLFSYPLS
jgi:hypothetical protein